MQEGKAATCLTNSKPFSNYQYRGGPKMQIASDMPCNTIVNFRVSQLHKLDSRCAIYLSYSNVKLCPPSSLFPLMDAPLLKLIYKTKFWVKISVSNSIKPSSTIYVLISLSVKLPKPIKMVCQQYPKSIARSRNALLLKYQMPTIQTKDSESLSDQIITCKLTLHSQP